MGNDGGSIPKRSELVRAAARAQTTSELKESQQEAQTHAWRTCALSHRPLQPPLVSDCAGALYNKDAVIEALLPAADGDAAAAAAKADAEKALAGRVRGLRDVVEVRFHEGAGGDGAWVCPLSSKTLGPATKAAYVVPCGHAFAEAALREVAELVCLQCNEPYAADGIITILPVKQEDKARLQARIERLRAEGLTHSLKKAAGKKKRKNGEADAPVKEKAAKVVQASGLRNAGTASLTAKVLAEEQANAKRRKLVQNDALKSLYSSGDKKRKDGDFMTRGYSIPANAKR